MPLKACGGHPEQPGFSNKKLLFPCGGQPPTPLFPLTDPPTPESGPAEAEVWCPWRGWTSSFAYACRIRIFAANSVVYAYIRHSYVCISSIYIYTPV